MRLKEPFNGIKLVGGHTLFHFSLLVTGLLIIGFPPSDFKGDKKMM